MPPTNVATTPAQAPMRYLQGIAVPAESVNPVEFFRRTRRHTMIERSAAFAGLSGQDVIELKKADVLAGIWIRFSGTLTTAAGTGAVATTRRWPYDLIRLCRFTANGQSNIISASGLKLKARAYMAGDSRSDRGVSQTIISTATNQGTLSDASESWGVGSGATGITDAARAVELSWFVPVAEDQVRLPGAIFAQTSSTDLTLTIDWNTLAALFVTSGTAAVTLTGTLTVESLKYSIPVGPSGEIVVPDLSVFHSLIQSQTSAIANGSNEVRLVGQGAGKTLLRAFFQTWNGAAPQVPLQMNATNYGRQSWRYAGNETPDEYADGAFLREINEATYNSDIGGVWGFGCHEFAAENAFRDSVDMGTASELRIATDIPAGVALTNPLLEYCTETIFAAGAGA